MAKKEAGAGRGFVNPQRTDERDEDYVTPAKHYEMRKEQLDAKEAAANEKGYDLSSRMSMNELMKKAKGGSVKKMASGGSASSRADGIAQRGKTRGMMC